MYSQNDEERVILEYFAGQTGRFLDVGSHDGVTLSNTRALAEAGWSGVLVEPSPIPFQNLLNLYGGDERMTLVNAAIAATAELKVFHDSSGDLVGSLNRKHVKKWRKGGVNFKPFVVHTVTAGALLGHVGQEFDFINLDVEGRSAALFYEMLAAGATARCWCIEHDGLANDLAARGAAIGLQELSRNGENLILGKQ